MRSPGGERIDGVLSGEANPAYVAFHRPRFRFLLDAVRPYVARAGCRVLDVGASQLTSLLGAELGLRVDSLGLEPDRQVVDGDGEVRHYRFDLNDAQHRERWRTDVGPYDVIVFAEVLEHLYTAPELVLAYLRELLAPAGLLLLQTPNAVALRKRARLLLGAHPYERIRVDRDNPGHFREYTAAELRELLTGAGFAIERVWMKYYFDARYARHERGDERPRPVLGAMKNAIYSLLPGQLREGITIAARKAR
jgi:2-polyprenyl-3-methyl-5-hydroxy-6-metoxy-1,4-benzoquinol methylase